MRHTPASPSSTKMELRKAQNPSRSFGASPAAALEALRRVIPWQQESDLRPELPAGELVYGFMQAVPAATFMGSAAAERRRSGHGRGER